MSSHKPNGLIFHVLSLALPMAWSRFIQMMGWFVGMLMVAHLGKEELAASALINATQITCCVIFMSLLFAIGVVAGRLFGEEKPYELGTLFQQSFIFSIIIGAVLSVVFYFIGDLLKLTGQSPQFTKISSEYFHVFAWVGIPLMLLVCVQQFCYGILKQHLVIVNNIFSLIILIPILYLFIFGKFGFPALKIRGLAVGIIIQSVINLISLLISLHYLPDVKKYRFFEWRQLKGVHYVRQLFQVGWPMSIQFGGELLAFFVMTLFTGWLGEAALSASQITFQVMLLFLIPLFAVAESAGILVSQAIGSRQWHVVERTGRVCIRIGLVAVLLLSILFFAIPNYLSAMYINIHDSANAQTVMLARWLFYLTALSLLGDTLRNLYVGALRGFYDTQYPMWLGLITLWLIAVPLSYVMGFSLEWGVIGIRMAAIIAFFIGALLLWMRWRSRIAAL
ncbi:MAG: hypothetical protein A3F10_01995 [Coxiella sp. RIFCSPHIGHO2_12_FULL_42_15]|nr:MAG: hypothetical protein A3F10_01995 [Coxiella sp. RIFCSPHIGHO2_12_FULL_42_15]